MRNAALALLMRALENEGILRVPLDKATDPAVLELVSRGFLKPLPTENGASTTDLLYQADILCLPEFGSNSDDPRTGPLQT